MVEKSKTLTANLYSNELDVYPENFRGYYDNFDSLNQFASLKWVYWNMGHNKIPRLLQAFALLDLFIIVVEILTSSFWPKIQ